MLWQYRTILFEFTKDGLLGDKYVDDEEMEKTLNEMGRHGWELVNVALLQDGLLTFLKIPIEEEQPVERALPSVPVFESSVMQPQRTTRQEREFDETAEQTEDDDIVRVREDVEGNRRRPPVKQQEMDFIGGIKIS